MTTLQEVEGLISSMTAGEKAQLLRSSDKGIDRIWAEETIFEGEIIEEYPDDKYSASCLILGKTRAGRELHVQASLPPLVVIVTVYEPDSEEWIEGKIRR